MNVQINTRRVVVSEALRAAIEQAAGDALEAMAAPPETPVAVSLRRYGESAAHRHHAVAVVEAPEGKLRAEGNGVEPDDDVANLHAALQRQAQQWRLRHAAPAGHPETAPRQNVRATAQAPQSAHGFGRPGENINLKADRRPRGYR